MSPGDTLGCNVDSYLIAMSIKTIVATSSDDVNMSSDDMYSSLMIIR